MEELGYDSSGSRTPRPCRCRPLLMLAAVAARTEKLKLGIGVPCCHHETRCCWRASSPPST